MDSENIQDLVGQHKSLVDQAAALLVDGATSEDEQKATAILDDADALQKRIDDAHAAAESKAAQRSRLDAANDWHNQSAGRLPGMGKSMGDGPAPHGVVEFKGGQAGVTSRGEFVPICPADEWRSSKQLQHLATPQYKAAFMDYLRGRYVADQKALSEGADTAGGFLVPPDFFAGVIQRLPGLAVVEEDARMVTTSRDRIQAPRVKAATSDSTMYTSAVAFTMVGENPASTEGDTEPIFEEVEIPVHTAKLQTKLSRNLIADTDFDLSGFLTDEFRKAATLGKDDKYLTGTGVREPLGVINDSDIATVASGAAATLTGDGLINLVEDLPAQYRPGAKLYLSKSAMKVVRTLKSGTGAYIFSGAHGANGGIADGAAPTIAGATYRITDFLDSVSAGTRPAFYGNLQYYWAVVRMALAIQVLKETSAKSNQDEFLGFLRFGGAVTVPEAFRIQVVQA